MALNEKYLKISLTLLLSFVFSYLAKSQNLSDTLRLPEFEIKSNFVMDNQGFKRIRMDSGLLVPNIKSDLSVLLTEHSTIFIKSYGAGNLATPSFRGTSAQHTQVEWNGISLNSPMLGQMDFSQVPVSQFDGLEIFFGAAGISRTSGAFGGVVDLVTAPDWNNTINVLISQTAASFATFTTNLGLAAGSRYLQSHTKFNFTTSRNDFPFTNNSGERVNQKNASYSQIGFSQELFWKLKDHHLFSGKFWYSENDRNLPPTTVNYDSAKTEKLFDKSIRAVAEYKLVMPGYNLLVRSALNDQYMNYTNSILDLNSVHHSWSFINRIRFAWVKVKNLAIKPGIDFTYDWVRSDDYDGMKRRSTTSISAEVNYTLLKKLQTSLVVREDIIDGSFLPLIATVGGEYRILKRDNLAFNANLARNYRYPTLNDLYWQGAGNPDLKPEYSYEIEGGATYNFESANNRFYLEASVAAYYSWLYDMITWTPDTNNSSLFKPENVDEILARGIEAGLNLNLKFSGFLLSMKNNYHFCRSTYEKGNSNYDNKIGKQQIYIPVNTFNSTLTLERWRFYLTYNFYYTGPRYTGKDNLTMMPGYNLSNIIFGKNFLMKDFTISLQIDFNNIFNLDYQSIASRPMPGFSYTFTLKLGFNGLKRNY